MSTPVPPDPTVGLAVGSSLPVDSNSQSGTQTSDSIPAAPIRLRDAPGEPTPVMHVSGGKNLPSAQETAGRLQFQGEIARGGMGAIIKGHDNLLGRDIAVKVLLQEHHGRGDFSQRFIEEAQITGQLQHPGIVPVYELGQFQDQRPFFTMKLVKGKTLAALMADRENPAEQRGRFIGIFAQVCQTLAYAHARGVIHRDLKPSNIMVGAFGEVQVMDWGLAKVLKEGGVADEKRAKQRADVSVIRTQRSGSGGSDLTVPSSYTQVGSILGTPSYLSPEQARGDVELVDERADVFGLGAILCEILTGDPPYTGRGPEATRKAQTGNLEDAWARLDACGADDDLIKLAKRCLAAEPWDRSRDAGVVAKEITAYQNTVDQRLREAELAQAAEAARAEEALLTARVAKAKAKAERKSRLMTLALAASVLVAAAIGAAGWRRHELDRIARSTAVNGRVNAALHEAMRFRGEAEGATTGDLAPWAAALTAARQAESLLESGVNAELREQVQMLLGQIKAGAEGAETAARTAERERQLLDRLVDIRSAKEDDPDGSATDSAYGDAFRQAGLDLESLSPAAIAAMLKGRPTNTVQTLAAFVDDWTQIRRKLSKESAIGQQGENAASDTAASVPPASDLLSKRLADAAQAIDPDPWRQKLRDALAQPEENRLAILQELATSKDHEDQGPVSLNLLGKALADNGDAKGAERVLRLAQQRHPEDVWINYDLATALARLSRNSEALRYFTAARALRPETAHNFAHALQTAGERDEAVLVFKELARLRPKDGRHWACLGSALQQQGQKEEADHAFDQAVVYLQEQIRATPDWAMLHNSLGIALEGKKQLEESAAAFGRGADLAPKSWLYRSNYGRRLIEVGREEDGIAELRKAVAIDPKSSGARTSLRTALRNKAQALRTRGELDQAVSIFREAVEADPKYVNAHEDLVATQKTAGRLNELIAEYQEALVRDPKALAALYGLGIALRSSGRLEDAAAAFRRAIDVDPKAAWLHNRLGLVLRDKGQLKEAIAEHRQATELDTRLSTYFYALGMALRANGQLDEALSALRKALEINPKYTVAQYSVGLVLAAKGQHDEAIAAYRKTTEFDPQYTSAHDALVAALKSQGGLEEAITDYRKALDTDPKNFAAQFGLALALHASGQLDAAIEAFRLAVTLEPKAAWLQSRLAAALRERGQTSEALAAYRAAVELDPKASTHQNALGMALAGSGQFDEAVAALRTAIELDPAYAGSYLNLGKVLSDQGRLDEAIAALEKAIEINPQYALAHNNLSDSLLRKGRLEEALAAAQKAVQFDSRSAINRHTLGEALAAKGDTAAALAAFRQALTLEKGFSQPHRELAKLLFQQHNYREALTHFEAAIAAKLRGVALYEAACCAALAAAATKDATSPDEKELVHWRRQALDWLHQELKQRSEQLHSGTSASAPSLLKDLETWKTDARLASLRDTDALSKLTTAERDECTRLWDDVAALLDKLSRAQ